MSTFGTAGARDDAVLVVDDDRTASSSLAAVLRSDGYQVLVANEPSEAIAIQYQHHPAAVIVDHQLSENAGLELAGRLKVRDPSAAVLVLTSVASLENVLAGASDLDGILVKPLVPQVFLQSVRNALSIRALAEENRRLSADVAQVDAHPGIARPVAGPPDLAHFVDRLAGALTVSQRDDSPLALVVLELGGWLTVQENLGQSTAEEIMGIAALRLAAGRRKSDLVGRVADNRFAVALADIHSSSDFRRVVRILLDEVEDPVTVDGVEHWLTPTAGAVLTDPSSPNESVDGVMDNAEVALTCARDEGRSWRLYEKTMQDRVFSRAAVGLSVRKAMDNHELAPVYQPVTDLHTTGLVGASVSLRWARPDETVLLSNEFLAEEGDLPLSAQVSAWMLDRAFSDLAAWQSARWLQSGFHLAIKVFAREVADPQFAETIEDLMEKHAIPAAMLSIDLSPQAARQAATANYALTRLSEVGVSFTLDDFGSAEAGLSWLRDLPINTLKLDSHLVESLDAPDDRRGTALVRAVIALGHTLHLAIVAKGVRTPAQRAALLAMGCEFGQDTQFGRPGPPEHPWSPDEIPSLSPTTAEPPQT